MSTHLRRSLSSTLVTGALVLAGTPLLASPASAVVPTVPGLGCLVNAAQTVGSNGGAVAIPDLGTATKTITVPTGGTLEWLRVRTNVLHPTVGQLTATLTSPAGSVITLTSGNGGANDNVFDGTWWQDDAGATSVVGSVTEALFTNGVTAPLLAPEEALSALRGEGVSGSWVLTVTDTLATSVGSLADWTLEYATRVGGAADTHTMGTGRQPGAEVMPGPSQTFTYEVTDAPPGSLEDVTAVLDIDGAANTVAASLVSPSGRDVTLTRGNGGIFSVFNGGTLLDDHAAVLPLLSPLSDLLGLVFSLPVSAPQEPLAALAGDSLEGVWTLRVQNLGALPITLNGWGLDLTSSSCGADGVLTALTTMPSNLPVGGTFAYAVQVTNNRLTNLDLANLGLGLPAGLQLVSATSTLGSCGGLNCALGTLVPGAQAVVVYLIKAVTGGVKSITVTLTNVGLLDALPLNNLLSLFTTVVPATGGGGAGGGTTTPATDTSTPGLVLVLGKDKLAKVAKKGVLALFGGTEAGRLAFTVKLPAKVAKKLGLPTKIGKGTVVLSKSATGKVRVKISKKAAKKLLRSGKKVRIIVKGQLRDAAGNVGKAKAGNTFKR